MYALCGRGNRSSLRVLRYGLPVDDFTKGAALPGVPTQVWSIRTTTNDEHHAYIVVSFVDSTLVSRFVVLLLLFLLLFFFLALFIDLFIDLLTEVRFF